MRLVILGTLFEFLQLFYIKTSNWELQCLQNTKSNTLYEAFECLLSVFNVNCMHQGSESNAISILCMYVLYMWKN